MCHQFHVKDWGAQDFEYHRPENLHNSTSCAVPLRWILLNSQLTVDLIANDKMLANIRIVQVKYAIRVHYNSGVKVVNIIVYLPGYGAVWYKLTGISNILLVSRVTKKFRVVLDREGGNFSKWSHWKGKSGIS